MLVNKYGTPSLIKLNEMKYDKSFTRADHESEKFYEIECAFEERDEFKYRIAFDAMEYGLIRLRDIIEIAAMYGISSNVVKFYRRKYMGN